MTRGLEIALVHVRHAGTGGTERYLNHLATHLAEQGHRPTIVCRRHEEAPHPGVRFERLRPVAVGGSWRMWSFARAVDRYLRRRPYDLVVGLGKTWTHDVVRLGGGLQRTYVETTLLPENAGRLPASRRLRNRLVTRIEERALAPGAYRRVIANAEMVRRDAMERYAIPPDAIDVVHNGVDLERFHPRRRDRDGAELRRSLGLGEEHVAVLFLGTGYARKGLDRLQRAFAALAPERPELRLVVVGYDSTRAEFEARGERLGIAGVTRFLGGRRDPETCFAAADLYCLPTRYDPFANSTLEALASGLPVVTSATNGGGEVLGPDAGEVVDLDPGAGPGAEAELTAALGRWCAPERLAQARGAARATAERHGIASKLEQTTRILLEVAAERPRG